MVCPGATSLLELLGGSALACVLTKAIIDQCGMTNINRVQLGPLFIFLVFLGLAILLYWSAAFGRATWRSLAKCFTARAFARQCLSIFNNY
jgi:hypothetical protein